MVAFVAAIVVAQVSDAALQSVDVILRIAELQPALQRGITRRDLDPAGAGFEKQRG